LITDIRVHLQITLLSNTPHFQVFMLSVVKNMVVFVCVCVGGVGGRRGSY